MTEYVKVKDNTGLVRDLNSKAVINTNISAYESAVARSRNAKKQRDEIRDATRQINTLKSEMHEIKGLLLELIERDSNVR